MADAAPVQLVGWQERGWVVVRRFLTRDQVELLRDEADRLMTNPRLFESRGAIPNSETRSDRLDPVIDLSPAYAELARDSRLLRVVEQALDGPPRLMKDKFIAKPPGAIGYAAHQDGAYWPGMGLDINRFLTAVLFLDRATAENGAIECAPGLHRQLLTDPGMVADPDEATLGEFDLIEAEPGDLLLLHALTPHRSGPNRSTGMRRALLFTYGVDPRPDLYDIYRRKRQCLS